MRDRKMFRAMEPDEDGSPKVGSEANMLGVRPLIDMKNKSSLAGPGLGGLSVFVDDRSRMLNALLPKEFGGPHALNALFVAPESILAPANLVLSEPNAKSHAVIEASRECSLDDFQQQLHSTRAMWRREEPK